MNAIFFDLDGTLLDTARDFAYAINILLARNQKPALNFDLFRDEVHGESRRMISFAFNMHETHPDFENIRQDFLKTYHENCTQQTLFFPGMESLLNSLDVNHIPWGIVTSKPTWLAEPVFTVTCCCFFRICNTC
jgi:phosphoglycolate phosphatase-like HAD superfamily hydrolase